MSHVRRTVVIAVEGEELVCRGRLQNRERVDPRIVDVMLVIIGEIGDGSEESSSSVERGRRRIRLILSTIFFF